jgi:uncharacterized membrane protein YkvA (DUF1232 family)
MQNKIDSWKAKAKKLKSEIRVLYLAYKDPRTPWYARVFAVLIIGYALSPIDLIPDFIPVLGYVDDLIIVPAGMALLLKMIPKEVVDEYRAKVESMPPTRKPRGWIGVIIIVLIWLLAIYLAAKIIW